MQGRTIPTAATEATMMITMPRLLLVTALALYSVLLFILDVITPPGIGIWVLNLPVIVVPVFFRSLRMVVFFSLACSALLIVGWVVSPPGNDPPLWDALNRGMGLAALWVIAVMAIIIIKKSTQLDNALNNLRREIAEHGRTSLALAGSEERLRLATEGAGIGTFDVDLQTGKVAWSATHLRMLGYQATCGRETTIDLWRSSIHPDDLVRVLDAREQALQRRSAYSVEYRINRADNGEIVWLAVFGRYYFNESGKAVRFLGVALDITQRRALEREARQREVLAVAAREQQRIGQELHDGVGQELTGLGLMAQSLAQRLPEAATEKRVARRLLAGLDSVHQKVRELSRGLIPVHVESRGLSAALDDLAARTAEATGISVTAECPDWVELPDHATAVELFYIAQEAVSNALRHGRSEHICLSLVTEPDGLRLRINDDGVGISGGPNQSNGLGLRIMQHRAELIGGVLHIGPSPGGGTAVTCTLPRSEGNDKKAPGSCLCQGENPDRG
jgi:PAS domain S-box-containing protein